MKDPIIEIPNASEETLSFLEKIGVIERNESGIKMKENIPATDRKSEQGHSANHTISAPIIPEEERKFNFNIKRKLNEFFRTHANYHVIDQDWKFRFYMKLVSLTDERRTR